ncbi:MAG: MBL fold metallo-hydrolase [Verrucomicrobiales bacterium]
MNRRSFLNQSTSCSAHILALGCVGSSLAGRVFAAADERRVVAREKWGRLEQVAPGAWALISTPFDTSDFKTVCNGGIVAGETGVLAIEAMMQPAGAAWLADQAKALTGRRPSDVVITHFHGDHSTGHSGYTSGGNSPRIWLTGETRKAAERDFAKKDPQVPAFARVEMVGAGGPTTIDLGGREVKVIPRRGHTSSDVTIELSDPKIVWTGDLFFNRMFPNYGDAKPDLLNQFGEHLGKLDKDVVIVPGHGPIADRPAVQNYRDFLAVVQAGATKAHRAGDGVEVAAEAFKLPESMSEWMIWSPDNIKKAFAAWYRVLGKQD